MVRLQGKCQGVGGELPKGESAGDRKGDGVETMVKIERQRFYTGLEFSRLEKVW